MTALLPSLYEELKRDDGQICFQLTSKFLTSQFSLFTERDIMDHLIPQSIQKLSLESAESPKPQPPPVDSIPLDLPIRYAQYTGEEVRQANQVSSIVFTPSHSSDCRTFRRSWPWSTSN